MQKYTRYRGREAHWRKIIEEWLTSGEKIKSFCSARKITVSGFYNWRGKLFPHLKSPSRNTIKTSVETSFLPVEIYTPHKKNKSELTLNLPKGCHITLNRDFDAVILQKLIETLGGKNVDVT